jgi:hypothetical protein
VAALVELEREMGVQPDWTARRSGKAESIVQTEVRLEAAEKGGVLWRNNVGAVTDANGNFFRYGLCNDTAAVNQTHKSADLIGIRTVIVEPQMVGSRIGQFVARETKKGGWHYTGTEREKAQLRFLELVTSFGGDAAFANGKGSL